MLIAPVIVCAVVAHGLQYNRALGVECTHCHVAGTWSDQSRPQFAITRNMARMVKALNGDQLRGIGEVACWICHGGQVKPARQPRAALDAELAKWPEELASAPDSQRLAMAVYDVALGVGCDHCHVADWKLAAKEPMRTVEKMAAMFEEFPKYMPQSARTQCYMCHKGSRKPKLRWSLSLEPGTSNPQDQKKGRTLAGPTFSPPDESNYQFTRTPNRMTRGATIA